MRRKRGVKPAVLTWSGAALSRAELAAAVGATGAAVDAAVGTAAAGGSLRFGGGAGGVAMSLHCAFGTRLLL